MNYRHIYHAGSFTDVFKHVVLVGLINALCLKEKGFCFLDTHAGIGRYDLFSEQAQKTQEFAEGIALLMNQPQDNMPDWVLQYRQIVESMNSPTLLRFYPGSPRVAKALLRPQDRMILTELHEEDVHFLKQEFKNDKQVAVHHLDGYQALKAFLPPAERRGLVLIDPPYEERDEFEHILRVLPTTTQRWNTGIYTIWYPIKHERMVQDFHRQLAYSGIEKLLLAEFETNADTTTGLRGCGMLIINPPWQFDQSLSAVVHWLWQLFSPNQLGGYRVLHPRHFM